MEAKENVENPEEAATAESGGPRPPLAWECILTAVGHGAVPHSSLSSPNACRRQGPSRAGEHGGPGAWDALGLWVFGPHSDWCGLFHTALLRGGPLHGGFPAQNSIMTFVITTIYLYRAPHAWMSRVVF